MKKKILFVFLILLYVFTGTNCEKKKNPTEPEENPPDTTQYVSQPQTDIPWPTLANSPCPIANYNPQRVARSKYKGPQQGKIKWTLFMGGKTTYAPVIGVDGTIYLTATRPGSGYSLYAVSPEGQIKWEFNQPEQQFQTSPIITADNSIILGTAFQYKPGGILYIINSDGSIKWEKEISTGIYCRGGLIDQDGNLYFTGFTKAEGPATIHRLYSFNSDGTVRWEISCEDNFNTYSYISMSPDGSTLYVQAEGKYIYAITQIDGAILWRRSSSYTYSAPIVDSDGNIYTRYDLSGESGIVSYDPVGEVRWKCNSLSKLSKSNSTLSEYFGEMCLNHNGYIYSYQGARLVSCDYIGQKRWLMELPCGSSQGETPVTCDKDSTIYVTAGQYLYAYNQEGEMLFECKFTDYNAYAGSLACDGIAYLLDPVGVLTAIE
jgi:hypothetical protein